MNLKKYMGINKKQAMEDNVEDHSLKYEQHLLESYNVLGYDSITTGSSYGGDIPETKVTSIPMTLTPLNTPLGKEDKNPILTEEYIIKTLEKELKELKEKQERSEQREREILQILSKLKPLKQMETLDF